MAAALTHALGEPVRYNACRPTYTAASASRAPTTSATCSQFKRDFERVYRALAQLSTCPRQLHPGNSGLRARGWPANAGAHPGRSEGGVKPRCAPHLSVVALIAARCLLRALVSGRASRRTCGTGSCRSNCATPACIDPARRDRAGVLAFSPQYPLWSDGAPKRRWIRLPPGTRDRRVAARRLGLPGRHEAVEGIQPRRARSRRATSSASPTALAFRQPTCGPPTAPTPCWRRTPAPYAGGRRAPGGRYAMPSRSDCLACHEGARGAGARLQRAAALARSRSAGAARRRARAGECRSASAGRARLAAQPAAGVARAPPRIARRTPTERAALGYLHANCGHCHNATARSPCSS